MAKFSNDELIAAFKEMTLIEPSNFVKLFEKIFDVEAAAPAAVAVTTPAADAPTAEEEDEFEVIPESTGDEKITVAKVVRNLAGLGLKEAKDLVDSAPFTIFPATKGGDAEKVKARIEEAGGRIALKWPSPSELFRLSPLV